MISFRRLPILIGAVLMLASAAFAQTAGTITVTGTTPEAFSLTSDTEGTLSATIAFGVMTPSNSTSVVSNTADVRLRSNKVYKVTAQASALSITTPGSPDGGDTISLSDFGFGIQLLDTTGANVAGSRTDAIVAGYDVTAGWPAAPAGTTPAFGKTLADITSSTQVLSGNRISKKGNMATTNNFIMARFGVATLPQFFTPNGGFSTVVTLTIASQ